MPRRSCGLLLVFLMLLRRTVAENAPASKPRRSFGEQLHIRHGSYGYVARGDPLSYPSSNYYDEEEVRTSIPPPNEEQDEDVYPSDLAEESRQSRQPPGAHSLFKEEDLARQELWGSYIAEDTRVTPMMDTAKCFSCMSKFYEAVWPALASVYKRPLNFTDRCNEDILETRSVPVTHCPTICVGMWEEVTIGGVKIRGHIRGCMDDLLHNGFNQTIVAWYRWMARDSCREYRKRELFKLGVGQSDESSIHLCTCYADHCNHAASPSTATPSTYGATPTTSLVCLATLLLILTQCWLDCPTPCQQNCMVIAGHGAEAHLDGAILSVHANSDVKPIKAQPMDSWQKRKRRKNI